MSETSDLPDEHQISRALDRAGLRYVQQLNPELTRQLSQWLNLLLAAPRNLTAVRDPAEAIERHVVEPLLGRHRLIAADLPVPHGPLIDIGSGNGAPGLPVALCEPDRAATMLDSRRGSTDFLTSVVEQIGADWISIHHDRAESAGRGALRGRFALALSRAVAPPNRAIELAVPLLQTGGLAVLWTGIMDAHALSGLDRAAVRLGAAATPLDGARDIQVFTKIEATASRYPRPWNQIRRRPLSEIDH